MHSNQGEGGVFYVVQQGLHMQMHVCGVCLKGRGADC
jgi:hypothetical protein